MLHSCKFSWNSSTGSWDIVQTRKCHADADADADADRNIKSEMRSFKSNENIHKKEGRSYYVVSANKASSVTL